MPVSEHRLSVSTVETHLERIYAKLGIHTRYKLIAMAATWQSGRKDSGSSPIAGTGHTLRRWPER
jgi:hypothetical protein